jgi:hypothetical protein
MAGAFLRIGRDRRQGRVNLVATGWRRARARRGRPERMGESDPPIVDRDDVAIERWLQDPIGRASEHPRQELDGRLGEGYHDGQGILGLGRQARQLLAEQGKQLVG